MTAENTDSGAETAPGTPPGPAVTLGSTQGPACTPARSGGTPGTLRDGGDSALVRPTPPAKRRPGKPKGYPKTGGRKKGTPNRCTVQTRDRIQQLADPIKFIADVMDGKRMVAAGEPGDMKKTWCYPTIEQRLKAGETLLRKLLPDLKATELTGPDGEPLIEPTRSAELYSTMEVARRVAFVMAGGIEAKRELGEMDEPSSDTAPELNPEPEPEPEPEPAEGVDASSAEPAEPLLPKHAYLYLEEGERERSGERAWLVMEGRQVHLTFHGADARQQARDWMGAKFGASPAEEIEVPLPDEEGEIE